MMFQNPTFLYALPAMLIPVVIHLFSFRRYRKVYFSNVAMLEAIHVETRKQSKLRHLLVLIARMLAVGALVTAFAQPFLPDQNKRTPTTGQTVVNLFIDNSFSMSAEGSRGMLLEQAKTKALDLVAAWPKTTRFRVFTHDLTYQSNQIMSQQQARQYLTNIDLTPASKSLSQWLTKQKTSALPTDHTYTFVFSDFQKGYADLQNISDTSQAVTLIPLVSNQTGNISIDTCYFDSPTLQIARPLQLKVVLSNHSTNRFDNLPLRLILNGQQKSSLSIALEAGQSSETTVPFMLTQPGNYQAEIQIDDSPVNFDNNYFLAFQLTEAINLLHLTGMQKQPWTQRLFDNDSTINLTQYTTDELDYSVIPRQNLIVADALTIIPDGLGTALNQFVIQGGSLWINPGKDDEPATINSLLAYFDNVQLLPADTQSLRVDMINQKAPLYIDAIEQVPANANLPFVKIHYPLKPGSANLSTPLLSLQNGDPLLISRAEGDGTVYLFCSPMTLEAGNFINHSLIVPTFYNAALLSRKPEIMSHILKTESAVRIPNRAAEGRLRIENIEQSFQQIPAIRTNATSTDVFLGSEIPDAGFYRLMNGSEELQPLAFNYSRAESVPRFQTPEELTDEIASRQLKGFKVVANPDLPAQTIISQTTNNQGLWKFFVVLVLIFLAIEVILLSLPERFFRIPKKQESGK